MGAFKKTPAKLRDWKQVEVASLCAKRGKEEGYSSSAE